MNTDRQADHMRRNIYREDRLLFTAYSIEEVIHVGRNAPSAFHIQSSFISNLCGFRTILLLYLHKCLVRCLLIPSNPWSFLCIVCPVEGSRTFVKTKRATLPRFLLEKWLVVRAISIFSFLPLRTAFRRFPYYSLKLPTPKGVLNLENSIMQAIK